MAYESGRLTGSEQTQIQKWALGYRLSWKKYDSEKEEFESKKILHLLLRATNNKLYEFAYPENVQKDVDEVDSVPYNSDDLEGLEKILDRMTSYQTGKSPSQQQQGDWGDWR